MTGRRERIEVPEVDPMGGAMDFLERAVLAAFRVYVRQKARTKPRSLTLSPSRFDAIDLGGEKENGCVPLHTPFGEIDLMRRPGVPDNVVDVEWLPPRSR